MRRTFTLLFFLHLAFIPSNLAHFILNYPPTLGFNGDNEDIGPCDGFSITLSNTSNFHVDGDSIALDTLHPQSNFLFRASVNLTGDPKNLDVNSWVVLLPVVLESGLGAFCEKSVAVPSTWACQQGILQITQDAEDGVHYQVCLHLDGCPT
jgi:hypothetical protein